MNVLVLQVTHEDPSTKPDHPFRANPEGPVQRANPAIPIRRPARDTHLAAYTKGLSPQTSHPPKPLTSAARAIPPPSHPRLPKNPIQFRPASKVRLGRGRCLPLPASRLRNLSRPAPDLAIPCVVLTLAFDPAIRQGNFNGLCEFLVGEIGESPVDFRWKTRKI